MLNNVKKLIIILRPKEGQVSLSQTVKAEDFFKLEASSGNSQADEEMKEGKEEVEVIDKEDAEQINQALQSINNDEFEIMQIIRFQSSNSYAQQVSVNEDFTKFLLTSSDRTLRLYEIDYDNMNQRKRSIFLLNEFTDVINKRKWMNATFFKLTPNQRLD